MASRGPSSPPLRRDSQGVGLGVCSQPLRSRESGPSSRARAGALGLGTVSHVLLAGWRPMVRSREAGGEEGSGGPQRVSRGLDPPCKLVRFIFCLENNSHWEFIGAVTCTSVLGYS